MVTISNYIVNTLNKLFLKYDLDNNQIYSNRKNYCAKCEKIITKENDSGWGIFVNGHIIQSVCKECNEKLDEIYEKSS
jgi:hypothetical protein